MLSWLPSTRSTETYWPFERHIGPLTCLIADGARWRREDWFPRTQPIADETERLLEFLRYRNRLEQFLPRLRDDARARDKALAEVRMAFFLSRNGFEVVAWEPFTGKGGHTGEFSVRWNGGPAIMVEVKAPDWQGELSEMEQRGDRKLLGKYVDGEARSVNSSAQPEYVIRRKAVPKLTETQPNLVVIADDLFISPVTSPCLGGRIEALLAEPNNNVIGGVLFFKASEYHNEVEYTIRFFPNPDALPACRIPLDVAKGLTLSSRNDEMKRLGRYPGPTMFKGSMGSV